MGTGSRGLPGPAAWTPIVLGLDVIEHADGDDQLDFLLHVVWTDWGRLAVDAAVNVACWCDRDQASHDADALSLVVGEETSLPRAFHADAERLIGWLTGPRNADFWRARAAFPPRRPVQGGAAVGIPLARPTAIHRKAHPLNPTSGTLSEDSWVLTASGPYPLWRLEGRRIRVARAHGPGFVEAEVSAAGPALLRTFRLDGGPVLTACPHTLLAAGAVRPTPPLPPRQRHGVAAVRPRPAKRFLPPSPVAAGALAPAARVGTAVLDGAQWSGEGDARDGYLTGHLIGDGHFVQTTAELNVWGHAEGAQRVREHITWCAEDFPRRSDARGWSYLARHDKWRYKLPVAALEMVLSYGVAPGSKRPGRLCEEGVAPAFLAGLLRSLFDCDGHVEGTPATAGVSIRLSQSDAKMLLRVQRMLSWLGVRSRIRLGHPARRHRMPDGRGGSRLYEAKEGWRLIISGADTLTYLQRAGFADTDKQNKYCAAVQGHTFYQKAYHDRLASAAPPIPGWGVRLTAGEEAWIAVDGVAVALRPGITRPRIPRGAAGVPLRARDREVRPSARQVADEHVQGENVTALALRHGVPHSQIRALLREAGQRELRGPELMPNAARALPAGELEQLYARHETHELAVMLGVRPDQVLDALARAGVKRRARNQRLGLERRVDRQTLEREYAQASLRELATRYGVSVSTVRNYLVRWGIARRPTGTRVPRDG